MTTENQVTAGLVGSGDWLGVCGLCSAPITRQKVPPPCHEKRMTCAACKKVARKRARANWAQKNPEKNRKYKRAKARRHTELRRHASRKHAEKARAIWSDADAQFLLENASLMTQAELGLALGRSLSAIETKLWRLRLSPNKVI